jgi:hypothetical protein
MTRYRRTPLRSIRMVAVAAVLAASALTVPAAAQDAPPEPDWAPVSDAPIRPGVRVSSESGSCTSNFVFFQRHEDERGALNFDVYIGLAAHCFSLGGVTGSNGCATSSRELGSPATVAGADHPGTLAYSSWDTMQEVAESNANACAVNDFALVRLDPRDHDKVNPTLRHFGGPGGLRTAGTGLGSAVYSYGNSPMRQGIAQLSPKRGWSIGTSHGGWNRQVYTVTPGVPGDSGSAVLDGQGHALGVLVTLQLAPFAGSNGVTDLARALDYANANAGIDIELAFGTEPFAAPLLP